MRKLKRFKVTTSPALSAFLASTRNVRFSGPLPVYGETVAAEVAEAYNQSRLARRDAGIAAEMKSLGLPLTNTSAETGKNP